MSSINRERRELFGSFLSFKKKEKSKNSYIRPPYCEEEDSFDKLCLDCMANCIEACNQSVLFLSNEKTPYLSFDNSGCTFCDECANACPNGVLNVINKSSNIFAKFEIDMIKCISWRGIMCFSCSEKCESKAIKFLGMFRPKIDENLCTSCGFCVAPCPSDAVGYVKID